MNSVTFLTFILSVTVSLNDLPVCDLKRSLIIKVFTLELSGIFAEIVDDLISWCLSPPSGAHGYCSQTDWIISVSKISRPTEHILIKGMKKLFFKMHFFRKTVTANQPKMALLHQCLSDIVSKLGKIVADNHPQFINYALTNYSMFLLIYP